MKFRTRTRRVVARKRAVWVNIPFGSVPFTESVGAQLLLVPEDWEASFTGLTNESAVLRAIVGEISLLPTTAGTAGGGQLFWGIYLAGIGAAVPTFSTTGMSEVTWLTTGSRAPTSALSSNFLQQSNLFTEKIFVKAKRKLTTQMQISICAQYGSDAASPAGTLGGLLRFLVARD